MEEEVKVSKKSYSSSTSSMEMEEEEVWGYVIPYIQESRDRDAVSLVCRSWKELDALTRKHVTVALCYSASPDRLRRRFNHVASLKLKGKPRASMFNLIPEDWGGYAKPWVIEISSFFNCLKSIHFRRMIIRDSDLELLIKARATTLHVLKLDKCSGFSTDGLLHIGTCRKLRTLFLEESVIVDNSSEWLHQLAVNNSVLETLNFYMTDVKVKYEDLVLIARKCRSLVSVKISDCEILDLLEFFAAANAASLEEFFGGSITEQQSPFGEQPNMYSAVSLPSRLCSLGLTYIGKNEMPMVFPLASRLKKLDLLYAFLDTEDHCLLIQKCTNLQVLETRNVIGDRGLEALAQSCKKLKRLRIERGADEQEMEDEEGVVSQRGLTALSQGCLDLEYIAVYVSDITNACLESIGTYSKKLNDFRLVLLDRQERIPDLPLDNGVRSLLRGCDKLKRFGMYLRPGGLTDVGLGYIGQYSQNVRWMLLGPAAESDEGLLAFSRGCPKLQKLEMRGCCFSERAIAAAVMQLKSLRYIWVHGYSASSQGGQDLLAMARPFWNIELIPSREVTVTNQFGESVVSVHPPHIIAYYSLDGTRSDYTDSVIPLYPT